MLRVELSYDQRTPYTEPQVVAVWQAIAGRGEIVEFGEGFIQVKTNDEDAVAEAIISTGHTREITSEQKVWTR